MGADTTLNISFRFIICGGRTRHYARVRPPNTNSCRDWAAGGAIEHVKHLDPELSSETVLECGEVPVPDGDTLLADLVLNSARMLAALDVTSGLHLSFPLSEYRLWPL